MKSLQARFEAGCPPWLLEPINDSGFTLIRDEGRAVEFSQRVRELLETRHKEFVVLPTSDGNLGYKRAIILPLFDKR